MTNDLVERCAFAAERVQMEWPDDTSGPPYVDIARAVIATIGAVLAGEHVRAINEGIGSLETEISDLRDSAKFNADRPFGARQSAKAEALAKEVDRLNEIAAVIAAIVEAKG